MLIRHSVLYVLGRAIPAGVGLLGLALYTRLLSPEEYGLYAVVVAAMSIINAVFFRWLSLSVGRFLPAHGSQPQALLAATLRAFLTLLVATGMLGAGAAWLWPNDALRGLVVLTVVLAWGQAWFDLNLQIANAGLAPVRYGVLSGAKALLALGLGVLLLSVGLGVTGIVLGMILGLLTSSTLALRYWQGCKLRWVGTKLLKDLVTYGWPLSLTFVMLLIVQVSDRFLLGWLIGAEAVGAYSAAYDLTQQPLTALTGVVHLAGFPLAVRALESEGVVEARKQVSDNGYVMLAISLPATVGLVLLAGNIVGAILGADFREGARPIMTWVALGTFFGTFKSYYLDYSFQLGRRMRSQVWTVAVAATVNLVLNLLLIPVYGTLGAAYATLGAFLVGALVSWRLGRTIFPVPLPQKIYQPMIASLGMAAVLWPTLAWQTPGYLAIQLCLGAGAYCLFLLLLRSDRMGLKRIQTYAFRRMR